MSSLGDAVGLNEDGLSARLEGSCAFGQISTFPRQSSVWCPAVVLPPLMEALGVRAALLSTLTAAPIPADDALGMGMVGMVADAEEREGLVTRLTKLSPGVVTFTKRLAAEVATAPAAEVDRMVAETGVATLRSEEARRMLSGG
ncbi:MAG: hypothetical protein J4G00_00735 [Actinomycetia bacterium]|nr:hypothetical protein [Actinomycetes bacterium]